jgi:hypothetical protein
MQKDMPLSKPVCLWQVILVFKFKIKGFSIYFNLTS